MIEHHFGNAIIRFERLTLSLSLLVYSNSDVAFHHDQTTFSRAVTTLICIRPASIIWSSKFSTVFYRRHGHS